jgi:hypothetical protein
MARDEALPFNRGETFYNGGTIDATDNTTLGGVNLEGQEFVVADTIRGTGLPITLRVVRNSGTLALLPKQLVRFDPAAGKFGVRCDQNTVLDGGYGYPVDELLPAAGVPSNDLFYIVVKGPALCKSPFGAGVTVAIGDNLVALTAAASTSNDAGKVTELAFALSANTTTETEIINKVGKAMSALTNGQTNTDLLVGIRW